MTRRTCARQGCTATWEVRPRQVPARVYCNQRCRLAAAADLLSPPAGAVLCACGCGLVFQQIRRGQLFATADHGKRHYYAKWAAKNALTKPAPAPALWAPKPGSRSYLAAQRAAVEICPACGAHLGAEGPLLYCRRRSVGCDWHVLIGQREPDLSAPDPEEEEDDAPPRARRIAASGSDLAWAVTR